MLRGQARVKRLKVLIKRLKAGGTVTKRDMRAVLTDDEIVEHDFRWQNAKEFNEDRQKTPAALKGYLGLLRRADALTQRANTLAGRGKREGAERLRAQAETACERALEHLEELLAEDATLIQWLDRPMDYTAGGAVSADVVLVPRLRAGRSIYKERDSAKRTKFRDVKLRTLEGKLAELTSEEKPTDERELRERLASLKRLASD